MNGANHPSRSDQLCEQNSECEFTLYIQLTSLLRQCLQPSRQQALGYRKADERPKPDVVVSHDSLESVDWLKDLTIKRWEHQRGVGAGTS